VSLNMLINTTPKSITISIQRLWRLVKRVNPH
jgi:hypothetical protein